MIRIGIICPSEIAFRRFLPALDKSGDFEYVGVAYANKSEWFGEDADNVSDNDYDIVKQQEYEKASRFKESYGGKIFEGYKNMLCSGEIDAVYIPLPPALHYKWAKQALEKGIHTEVEEGGSRFSEGQKQRLSIARALMVHAPILLLDEATSALDMATERKVLQNIMKKDPLQTIIVTAHRPSVLAMCSRVYKIQDKCIDEVNEAEVQKFLNDTL